ncbi:alpha/beta fold hydrolase [Chelatococcus sp. GCM10030263]|uniref:alpha/beta fold hydrolase n=1 Tax=Chelatococcus sp. GCM10030263 TaxID=3273387 RepID=UPI00361D1218
MTKLHVVTRGDRSKPAILFVHALGTDHRFWDEVVAGLEGSYFCITPDLQAAGKTPNPPQPVDAAGHAADLAAVLRDLGVARAVLVGCAIGGMVAAGLAATHPDLAAGLVMTNPGVRNADEVKGILRARVDEVRQHGMQVLLPAAPERSFHGMPRDARYDLYVERYVAQDPEGYALSVLGFLDIDIMPILPQIKCPLLLIPGGNDVLMPRDSAEVIAARVAQAEIVRFEEAAHFIPFQVPQQFLEALRAFLAKVVK